VDRLRIGLIQTSLDHGAAWAGGPKMTRPEEDRAISEITKFIAGFKQETPSPEIILLPELAVPRGFIPTLRRMARSLSAIIVAGLDYRELIGDAGQEVANEAIIIVPDRWRNRKIGATTTVRIFDGGEIGRFGVAICYDFLDLERVAAYREQIQHLFVLSYNRDTGSFEHAAEAMSRMIFCNVVVCNTGFYGGSLAVSPYYRPQRRTIYKHCGAELITSQIIELPVKNLWEHQQGKSAPKSLPAGFEPPFKGLPAGYKTGVSSIVRPVPV
jgi:predicted amidohydrolase